MLFSRATTSVLRSVAYASLFALPLACAAGNTTPEGGGGSSEGGGGASSGTGGAMGGAGGMGSGMSSASMSSSSSSASSSASSGTGGSGGGMNGTATKIVSVYGGGSAIIANSTDVSGGSGFSTPWTEQSEEAIGLASDDNGVGITLLRASATGEIKVAFYSNGQWSPGLGQPLPSLELGLKCEGGPSLAGGGGLGHATYRGTDGFYYYARTQNKLWLSVKESITFGGKQSTGPQPPAIAAVGNQPVIAFVGADQIFYDQSRAGGAWSAPTPHTFSGQAAPTTPAIVALDAGPELVAVFAEASTSKLFWLMRKTNVWSTPTELPGATAVGSPALAPLPGGGAVLAFQGTDQRIYTAQLSAGDMPTWSKVEMGLSGVNPTLKAPPAVARGAKGAQAELIYVDLQSTVHSTRLVAGEWSAPVLAGSASARVNIATIQ